jgi:hypothetical protein
MVAALVSVAAAIVDGIAEVVPISEPLRRPSSLVATGLSIGVVVLVLSRYRQSPADPAERRRIGRRTFWLGVVTAAAAGGYWYVTELLRPQSVALTVVAYGVLFTCFALTLMHGSIAMADVSSPSA